MRFLIDMPLSPGLARWLVQAGHDAIHASERSLDRAPDTELLRLALAEGRIIITADLDYPRILALTDAEGPALILFRGGNFSELESQSRLARVLSAIPTDDLMRSIIVIEKERIRRRRLPLEGGK